MSKENVLPLIYISQNKYLLSNDEDPTFNLQWVNKKNNKFMEIEYATKISNISVSTQGGGRAAGQLKWKNALGGLEIDK